MILTYYEPKYWNSAANQLVKAIQEFCKKVAVKPLEYGVADFWSLEDRLWEHINEIKGQYPRCNTKHLKIKIENLWPATKSFYFIKDKLLETGCNLEELNEWSFEVIHRSDKAFLSVKIRAVY